MSLAKQISVFTLLPALILLSSCGGGDSESENTQDNNNIASTAATVTKSSLYVHPTDSSLLSFSTDQGESFTLTGKRDFSGNPLTINEIEYTDANGRQYQILYDDAGVPKTVINEEGTSITFDFFTGSAGSGQSISRAVQPYGETEINSVAITVKGASAGEAIQTETVLDLEQPVIISPSQAVATNNAVEPAHNVTVNVNQCDQPANPDGGVYVQFKGKNQNNPDLYQTFKAHPSSVSGQYHALIPQRDPEWLDDAVAAAWQAVEDGANAVDGAVDYVRTPCQYVAKAVSATCAVIDTLEPKGGGISLADVSYPLCTSISLQLEAATLAIPGDFALFFPTCLALVNGSNAACKTLLAQDLNAHPNPISDQSYNVIGEICEARTAAPIEYINNATEGWDNKLIRPMADMAVIGQNALSATGVNPDRVYGAELEAPATGPFPNLTINHSEPVIDRFVLSPRRPDTREGYTGSAEFSCVKNNELVVSYQGSDGQAGAEFATALTQGAELSIDVPARSKHVDKDVFSVSARDLNTNTMVGKTIPVVFSSEKDDTAGPDGTTAPQDPVLFTYGFYYNRDNDFASPLDADYDSAASDIQLSSTTNGIGISWQGGPAAAVGLLNLEDSSFVYGITGIGVGAAVNSITSPVQYGDYSISETIPSGSAPSVAPTLSSGQLYQVQVEWRGSNGQIESSWLQFRINK